MAKGSGSNVVALQAELLGLGFACTGGLGKRIEGSRNEIWRCHAYDQFERQVVVYVKVGLSQRAILVEALAAQIANAIGLRSPAPYLCQVQSQHVGRPRGQRFLTFASASASEKDLARPLRNLDQLLRMLGAHKVSELAAVMDEWIGNDVRSPSDILICPEQGPIFIDHEAAMPAGADPGDSLTNWLAGRLLEGLDTDDRKTLLDRLRRRCAALHRLRMDTIPGVLTAIQGGTALYAELVQFLQARLSHLDRLLSERVLPEQQYLAASPHADEPHAAPVFTATPHAIP